MNITAPYNRDDFMSFLSGRFLPDDFEPCLNTVSVDNSHTVIKNTVKLGFCSSLDLSVYEFRHSGILDPRVTLSRESFKIIETNDTASNALAIFYSDAAHWRLSLITSDYSIGKTTKHVKHTFSNPRRYSYLLGKNCKKHTPESMLNRKDNPVKTVQELKGRFAIEVVTEVFYKELFKWYEWAKNLAEFPDGSGGDKPKRIKKGNELHLIRLITRLVFVWFMRQSNLIPEWVFDKMELSKILVDFSPDSEKNGTYYNAVLQNLFFATLNREILDAKGKPNRCFTEHDDESINSDYAITYKYRDNKGKSFFRKDHHEIIKLFAIVPFLNGGLFECLDSYVADGDGKRHGTKYYKDGFSREESRRAFVPDCLFWNDEKTGHEGIISILSRYNFTVEENTPSDIDVALDPELLGKVFENLLGYFNPETHEMARKSSGSFYTPREIVNYMVDESLVTYLATNIPSLDDENIRSLFSVDFSDDNKTVFANKEQILFLLKKVKILDPACGSGAFPMGILNRLTDIIQKLEGAKTRRKMYELKLHLIENCIYGIDIQPIAVQIAKLRFFISLVCEQERNDNIQENYGIRPLPNLETKFVAANTLIGLSSESEGTLDMRDDKLTELKNVLWEIRKNHFYAKDSEEKKQLQRDDEEKRKEITDYLLRKGNRPDNIRLFQLNREIEVLQQERLAVAHEEFVDDDQAQTDFDFGLNQSPKTLFQVDKNKPGRDAIDREIKRLTTEIDHEQNKGKNLEVFENAIKDLAHWNPYDQNDYSRFFDIVWMFGLTGGFDVVIGNPPYVSTKGVSVEDKILLEKEYGFADDTYNHFFFKGNALLNQKGILTYISPKTFWTTQTKKNLRDLLLAKKVLYFFDTANPFKAAMVDTCITSIQNVSPENNQIHFLDGSKDLKNPQMFTISQSMYLNAQNIVIFKPNPENLKIYSLYGQKVKELYNKWWDKISTSKNIEKNQKELEEYRKSLKPGDVALLGCLTEGGQGLATANNGKYIAVRKSTKWAKGIQDSRPKKLAEAIRAHNVKMPEINKYGNTKDFLDSLTEQQIAKLFDELKEKYGRDIFGQGYIYRLIDDSEIADVDMLTEDEKKNGISKNKKYYVPYDKGDKDGNRWYLETPFAIAWSKDNVQYLKTDLKARYQGYMYFFREGFCWTNILNPQARLLKAKVKAKTVNDVGSMSLSSICDLVPNFYLVVLLNSEILFDYYREFINCSVNIQINDIRQLPIIIPTQKQLNGFKKEFEKAVNLKKEYFNGHFKEIDIDYKLAGIEHNMNKFVENLYYSI
jgi:methylase of polypeptide subunit release factors